MLIKVCVLHYAIHGFLLSQNPSFVMLIITTDRQFFEEASVVDQICANISTDNQEFGLVLRQRRICSEAEFKSKYQAKNWTHVNSLV